jgi:hypothetical protein
MKIEHKEVSRTVEIAGIGKRDRSHADLTDPVTKAKYPKEGVPFQVCETLADVNEVLKGATAEEKQKEMIDLVNFARWSQLRSEISAKLAGTGRKSAISAVRKMVKMLQGMNPGLSAEALATQVLAMPGIKAQLEAEGLSIEETLTADETEEVEAEA